MLKFSIKISANSPINIQGTECKTSQIISNFTPSLSFHSLEKYSDFYRHESFILVGFTSCNQILDHRNLH